MIKEKIKADTLTALKSGDSFMAGVLRLLLAAIQRVEVDARGTEKEIGEEVFVKTLESEAKKRKEAIKLYERGGRAELAQNEKKELEVVERYLPARASEAEILKVIEEAKKNSSEFKVIIKEVMAKLAGRADGGEVSILVKNQLNG